MKTSVIPRAAICALLILLMTSFLLTSCDIGEVVNSLIGDDNENDSVELKEYNEYYGYRSLGKCDNADTLQYIYASIAYAAENSKEDADLSGKKDISGTDVETALHEFIYDHPEFFALDTSSYELMIDSNDAVKGVRLSYLFDKEEQVKAQKKINDAVNALLEQVSALNAYDQELFFHDWIVENTTYKDGKNAHNIYGVFVDGAAVCEGYAKAFQFLLQKAGFESYMVAGTGRNTSHAWTLLKFADEYCYVDPTWDDTESDYVSHAYFNITTEVMLEEHTPDKRPVSLPECRNKALWYFSYYNRALSKPYNVNLLKGFIENDTLTVAVNDIDELDDFQKFLKDHLSDIFGNSGKTVSANLMINGREVYVYIS